MNGAHDHLCAVDGALNIRGDAYVALDDLDRRVVEVSGACADAREHPYRRPSGNQALHQEGTEMPGAAGNEDHRPSGGVAPGPAARATCARTASSTFPPPCCTGSRYKRAHAMASSSTPKM